MFSKTPNHGKEGKSNAPPCGSPPRLGEASHEAGGRIGKLMRIISRQPPSYANKKDYIFGRTLGAGAFGVVRQAKRLSTGEDVAIKILLKRALNKDELQTLYDELHILQRMHHPNIVKFKDWFESKDKFYIVTQLATGGELFERILKKGKFSEVDAVKIILQILSAVQYMHSQYVVHRDLKPENVLYLDPSDDSELVISDFGIARQLSSSNQLIHHAAGSMGYVAPEVLTVSGHGKPCDIWSVGVITYTLLCGYSPFVAETAEGFIEEVTKGRYPVTFHSPYWDSISTEARKFILRALILDPAERPTATELLQDQWIVSKQTRTTDLLPSIRKGFDASRKLREALHVVILNNRIKKLRQLYGADENSNREDSDSDDDIVEEVTSVSASSVLPGSFSSPNHKTSSSLDVSPPPSSNHNGETTEVESLQNTFTSISQFSKVDDQKQIRSQLNQNVFARLVLAASNNKELIRKYQKTTDEEEANPSK